MVIAKRMKTSCMEWFSKVHESQHDFSSYRSKIKYKSQVWLARGERIHHINICKAGTLYLCAEQLIVKFVHSTGAAVIGFVMKWCLVPQVRVPLLARRTPHKWAVEACIIADGTGLVVEAVCSFGTEGTTEKVETRRQHRRLI